MERSEALVLVGLLQANFRGGGEVPDETVELVAQGLCRYSADIGQAAVRDLIEDRSAPFFPTWAEIKQAVMAEINRLRIRDQLERPALEEPLVGPTPEFQQLARRLALGPLDVPRGKAFDDDIHRRCR
ncbi:MAG: hypothetical protein QOJ13_937 [Gaiellales bacterium]|jgi:hypothetical protein|nr:hypothetical protein [Gaiellales bacterium]